eukprot:m.287348 g.287348  ORF g.287348 m.287348 type:complete len:280 (+) comp11757_c0_seq1:59-898(+)
MSFDSWDNSGGGGRGGYQSGVRDGDTQYIRMSQHITSSIYEIGQKTSQMQKMTAQVGTARDTHDFRKRVDAVREQSKRLVLETKVAIKQLGELDGGSSAEQKKRRMQQEKFMAELAKATEQWKHAAQVLADKESSVLQAERARTASFRAQRDDDMDDQRALIDDHRRREQEQLDEQIDINEALIEEREQGIQAIERDMMEINDIFRDLNTAVVDQGVILDHIESNMFSTSNNVERGTQELTKASHYQKKARNKMMCLLVIVAIVAAILVIVLVTTLKKK